MRPPFAYWSGINQLGLHTSKQIGRSRLSNLKSHKKNYFQLSHMARNSVQTKQTFNKILNYFQCIIHAIYNLIVGLFIFMSFAARKQEVPFYMWRERLIFCLILVFQINFLSIQIEPWGVNFLSIKIENHQELVVEEEGYYTGRYMCKVREGRRLGRRWCKWRWHQRQQGRGPEAGKCLRQRSTV